MIVGLSPLHGKKAIKPNPLMSHPSRSYCFFYKQVLCNTEIIDKCKTRELSTFYSKILTEQCTTREN